MSDLLGDPEDRFSCDMAHILTNNNKDVDQSVHLHHMITVLLFLCMDSKTSLIST